MRPRLAATSVTLAVLVAFTLAAPVAATSPWTTFKQSGTQAIAFTGACFDNSDGTVTCEGRSLDAFDGTIRQSGEPTVTGEQVCYSEHSETFDPRTGEGVEFRSVFGCALHAGTLSVHQLDSVTLAPTVIELTEMRCDATGCSESSGGSITVHGEWTGIGAETSQKGRFSFDDGTCIQINADKSTSRLAAFEGSIDAVEARIGHGTFTFRTTCAFEPG